MALQLVTPHDIAVLDDSAFNSLIGDLVLCEMLRHGLHASRISRTDKTSAKDGGIDLRVTEGAPTDGWLPRAPSAWQFKSGDCPSVAQLTGISKPRSTTKKPSVSSKRSAKPPEFIKPGVLKAAQNGEVYVFVAADDLAEKKKEIREAFQTLHPGASIVVHGGSDIATWASELPAVAARHFPRVGWLNNWMPWNEWSELGSMSTRFHPDEARTQLVRDLRARG